MTDGPSAREQERLIRAQVAQASSDRADRVLQNRLEQQQLKAAKEEAKAAKKAAAQGKTAGQKFASRLVTLIELGGIGLVIYVLRKPLEHVVLRIAVDIYKTAHVLEDGLKDVATAVQATDLKIRKDIVARYFEDPILMHKLGPNLYTQLVTNAHWEESIINPDTAYPGAVSDLFIVGTGRGATQLRGAIVHGISLQIWAIVEWLIGNGANLQKIGRFENLE
jgi:hypothetical protein